MSRRGLNIVLPVLLALALVFLFTSCENFKISHLKANHHFNKANHYYKESQYRKAIEEYEKALEDNPNLIDAYRLLGESYKSLYRPGEETEKNRQYAENALAALNKAYEIDPSNRSIIHSLGDMYDKMRNYEEAEKLFLKILEMDPTNMGNYYVVAEFYRRYSGNSEAEGEQQVQVGKTPFQKAVEMYLRRIELDPENPQGYAYLAQFYENLTPVPAFDEANFYFEKRIQLEPENAEAWLAKGVNRWAKVYRIQSKLTREERIKLAEDSEKALRKANELDAQYSLPYSWLSVLYRSVLTKLYPDRARRFEEEGDRFSEKFQELRRREAERERLQEELRQVR